MVMNNKVLKWIIVVCSLFALFGFWFMFGGKTFNTERKTLSDITVMPEANGSTEEITERIVIEQQFISSLNSIEKVAIVFNRLYQPEKEAFIAIELSDDQGVIGYKRINVSEIESQHRTFVDVKSTQNLKDKELVLRIYSDSEVDTGMALMMKYEEGLSFKFGNMTINGTLCFNVVGE